MTWLMIALVIIAGSVGDILLSRGMKQLGEVHSLEWRFLLRTAKRAVLNPWLVSGVFGMAVAFFSLMAVLSWAPLSLVEPATALSYVFNTFGAKFLLKEKVDAGRWIGTAFVCAGAALLSF